MPARFPVLLVGLAAVAVLAACTTPSAGQPSPETTSTSAPSRTSESEKPDGDDLPAHGAPKVENPLDVSEYEQDPCKALTQQQANELDVPDSGANDGSFGKECTWRKPGLDGGSLALTFFTEIAEGLSSVYEEAENNKFPFFEEISKIEGLPAVAYTTTEATPTAVCSVSIGVSDQLAFDVRVHLSSANTGQKDPCETAATVAEMMLKNMKAE